MNRQKISVHTLMCLLTCATAACSNDLEQKEIPAPEEGGRITVTAGAGMPQDQPSTRVDFNDADGSQLEITWRDDSQNPETFSVFSGADDTKPSTFTLESVDPSNPHQANFTGEIIPTNGGTTYYALYPAVSTGSTNASASAGTIPLNLTAQTGILDENKLYMYGSSQYESNNALNFSFNHLTSIVKVTMQFPAEVKVNQPAYMPIENINASTRALSGGLMTDVTFAADGLYLTANVDLATQAYSHPSPNPDGSITLSESFSLSSETQPSATVYLYVLPGGLTDFKVKAKADGKSYIATISADIKIVAGKMYTKTVEMKEDPLADAKVGDFYCKDSDGNGYLVSGSAGLTDAQKNDCLGIVCWVGSEALEQDPLLKSKYPNCSHGLVVALQNAGANMNWSKESEFVQQVWVQNSPTYSVVNIQSDDKMCGYSNTLALMAYNKEKDANDEFRVLPCDAILEYSDSHPAPANSSGWYLPSIVELKYVCWGQGEEVKGTTGRDLLNTQIDKVTGGTRLGRAAYWSSTENSGFSSGAWGVGFDSGHVDNSSHKEINIFLVRLLLAF